MKKNAFFLIIAVICISFGVYLMFFKDGIRKTNKSNYKDRYDGRWAHYVSWEKDGNVVRKSYSELYFKDGEWSYLGYDLKDDGYTNEKKISGTYEIKESNLGKIYCYYEEDGENYYIEMYVNGDKMCQSKSRCSNYFVKENSKLDNHLTLEEIKD